jgi:DNA-binding transcriptional MerR regulator
MRIGELSDATGASPRSLRHYEKLGLISSARLANGYRDYDASAVATVSTIRSLLDLGFPTALIERILPCTGEAGTAGGDCAALSRQMTRIRDEMDSKVQRFSATRDTLTRFLSNIEATAP